MSGPVLRCIPTAASKACHQSTVGRKVGQQGNALVILSQPSPLNSYRPRETMHRTRIAAAIERKRMKQFLLDLVEAHLLEMEKKGLLPKGK